MPYENRSFDIVETCGARDDVRLQDLPGALT